MSYMERIVAKPPEERWHVVKGLMASEPHPFFAEMRDTHPILALPNLTLVFRFADCSLVLRRHDDFGVDLYKPKQGDYFMAQDDTAEHWREKSITRAILDFEQIPDIRNFVADTAAAILREGRGRIDMPQVLTRAVPVAIVRKFFGFSGIDAKSLTDYSYWNQQDAFHNQPFDEASDAELIIEERKKANIALAAKLGWILTKRYIPARLRLAPNDSVTRLLKLNFSGALKFPLSKVLFNAGGLLIGAVETTSHCVNNVMAELFDRPDALAAAIAAARNDPPEAIDAVALEALRFRPAFPYFFRTCHKETELAGGTAFAAKVAPGTTVLAVTHSAMADCASFPDPATFDPARPQGDNFTFGQGIHECLGRAIAKPMIGEIVRQILRLPGLAAAGPVEFKRGVPEGFPIRWDN
ncbi:MAG: cytochrome P450 [Sphingobium sp.]|nr:cytochrome P450 [Sphingobium sp.]